FESRHRAGSLWRLVMGFGLFCTTTHVAFAQLSLTISSPPILPDGLLNTAYSYTLSAVGGTPPYTWAFRSGKLPSGIAFDAASGGLSGTPTAVAMFKFRIRVTDSLKKNADKDFTLTINNPIPLTSGINPTSTNAGGPAFTLTVSGLNFVSGSTVRWNGSDRPTTFNNATTLTASISAGDIVSSGTASITVNNPGPGGGASNEMGFATRSHRASISGINPTAANAGGPAFTLTVSGSNFISGSTVRWNGSDRPTTFNSATTLTASISASDIVSAGTASITVNNPGPGGGLSNALSFTISTALTITTSATLPEGTVNTAYSGTLSASGGTPPYTWSVSSGSVPPGLSLSASDGKLSGTLTSAGTFSFTVQVLDSANTSATKQLTLAIKNPLPSI